LVQHHGAGVAAVQRLDLRAFAVQRHDRAFTLSAS